ncbi:aminomethyltransferase, mitochondrial isoform X2 [Rhodnius prolixus]
MVNFGGFLLPVQYGAENISESHLHTRKKCSLFDVSHMLQTEVTGKDRVQFFESLCTADIVGMKDNTSSLSLFTDKTSGGILDDLIVTKCEDHLYIVSNASRREHDSNLMLKRQEELQEKGYEINIKFYEPEEKSLVALQGPSSAKTLQDLLGNELNLANMSFMTTTLAKIKGIPTRITRCGYTGEDGFEISLSSENVVEFASLLTSQPDVKLAGLGARDTLRLEAGLCLYGNDIDKTTTPVSAVLMWTIGKRRKELMDFPGAQAIMAEQKEGPKTKRVGLIATGRSPPARQGCLVHDCDGNLIGRITSGCPSPSLNTNIAMAYVNVDLSKPNTSLTATVRGLEVPVKVAKMPFIKPGYYTVKS